MNKLFGLSLLSLTLIIFTISAVTEANVNRQNKQKGIVILDLNEIAHLLDEIECLLIEGKTNIHQKYTLSTVTNITALMLATYAGREDIVRLLLQAGAPVNDRESLGNTALIYAASYGRNNIAQLLVNAGANINMLAENKTTALIVAVETNSVDIVKMLLKAKANINIKDESGKTALDYAKLRKDNYKDKNGRDIIHLLLEAQSQQKSVKLINK